MDFSKYFLIPQRYVLAIMGFLAILNAYTMRISLSIAMTEMVVPAAQSNVTITDSCPYPNDTPASIISISNSTDSLFDWSDETQGLILSAFYWGYIISHLPGGILAEKFGGKYTLGLGILSTAVFTIITPVVARATNWVWMCALRMLVGIGEGTTFPALNAILAKWVPLNERAKLGSLTFAGSLLGTVVANSAGGIIIAHTGDWASVFYVFGGLGVVWFVFWTILCYSDPQSHPFISEKERVFLENELSGISKVRSPVPWKSVALSAPVWALVAAQIGHDWGFYAMVTDLPKYMKDVLKFSVAENGILSSLPYALMWIVSVSGGWLCDWLIKSNIWGITFSRKFFTAFAAVVPGLFILGASYAGCDRTMTVILFTIAMGAMGPFYFSMKLNALDLAPNYAGTLMAIVNGMGAICGMVAPTLIGTITSNHTISEWRLVFWITLAILAVTSVVYVVWGSGEEQPWNLPEKNGQKEEAAEMAQLSSQYVRKHGSIS